MNKNYLAVKMAKEYLEKVNASLLLKNLMWVCETRDNYKTVLLSTANVNTPDLTIECFYIGDAHGANTFAYGLYIQMSLMQGEQ